MRLSLLASFLIHAGAAAALLGVAMRAGRSVEAAPAQFEFAIQSDELDAEAVREPEHSPSAPATPRERFPAIHEEDPEPVTEEFTVRPLPAVEAPALPRFARLARPLRDPRATPAAAGPVPAAPAFAPTPARTLEPPRPVAGRCPPPTYPPRALDLELEGVVFLRVRISAEGRVERCVIDTSSGYESLDEAAADAVTRWRFEPARRGDRPQAHWLRVPIRFRLRD